MRRVLITVCALVAVAGAGSTALAQGDLAARGGLEGELSVAAPSWDACEGAHGRGKYLLGRYEKNLAVVEVGASSAPELAKLWAHARPGGTPVAWPGGRIGVRHLDNPHSFAAATPLASAGRLYVWENQNGWGNTLAQITGVELAKSLCNAGNLVVYLVLRFEQPGEGYLIASVTPPQSSDAIPVLADPPKEVMNKLYASILERLRLGLKAQKLAPSQVTLSVLPGHFTGAEALEYTVSLRWANTFDDRFSLVCLADQTGTITRVVDRQEGGAGGLAVEVADVDGTGGVGAQDLIYELTTLDGSSAALWSLKGGKVSPLVQTTPVGD